MNRNFIIIILSLVLAASIGFSQWRNVDDKTKKVNIVSTTSMQQQKYTHRKTGQLKDPSIKNPGDRLTRLENEVLILKTQLNTIKEELKTATHDTGGYAPLITNSASVDQEPSPEDMADLRDYEIEQQKLGEEQFNQKIIRIEDRFLTEPVNVGWSNPTIDSIHMALDSLPNEALTGTVLRDIECRTTMCRMIFESDGSMAQDALEEQLPMLVGEILPRLTATHEDDNGIVRSIYFLQLDEENPTL